ncbi:MAG: glycosyltransferase 87 family protein [Flavobacteriales bacterium]
MHHRSGVANFEVYYKASEMLMDGQDFYGVSLDGGEGYYKYAPICTVAFIPFTFIPYGFADAVYYFLVLASFIVFTLFIIYWLEITLGVIPKSLGWLILLVNLFLVDHFERELHLGNLNVFLHIGFFSVFVLLQKGRNVTASILNGVLLLFQPWYALISIYFLIKGKIKHVLLSILFFAVGLILPIVFLGVEKNTELLQAWMDFYFHPNYLLADSPNTLYGIYNMWVLSPMGFHSSWSLVISFQVLVALAIFVIDRWNKRFNRSPWSEFFEISVVLALIPNLIHTDTEHFMWSWPLLVMIFLLLQQITTSARIWWSILMTLIFIPFVVNSPDIVGRKWMLIFDEGGFLGFANFLIVITGIVLFYMVGKKYAT